MSEKKRGKEQGGGRAEARKGKRDPRRGGGEELEIQTVYMLTDWTKLHIQDAAINWRYSYFIRCD